jgi:hypothetical protein
MRARRLFIPFGILLVTLACLFYDFPRRIPFIHNNIEYYSTDVINVAVLPPSGRSNFILVVQFDADKEFQGASTHYFPGWITCYYTTPDGATFPIGKLPWLPRCSCLEC